MRRALRRPAAAVARRFGYELRKAGVKRKHPPDIDDFTRSVVDRIAPYTLTSVERAMALVEVVRYAVRAGVPGAFVECGVWRGGSSMAMALTLLEQGVTDRDLVLFDTFTHMPEPDDVDVDLHGNKAADFYDEANEAEAFRYLTFDEVRAAIESTGYPPERIHLVQGMVEETIPERAPDTIAVCRLDTDWYSSTAHEMTHLWPRIPSGGVMIVDDYGHFMGAKKAVDEYIAANDLAVLLHRIDFTGRTIVKP